MISPEEDDVAFSTKSTDQWERIEARRRRIAARLEEAKKVVQGRRELNEDDLRALREKNRKSVQQKIASRLRLYKLKKDGMDMSENVRVAFTARELQRRGDETDNLKARNEKIDSEQIASFERIFEVTKKWDVAKTKVLAQELQDLLVQQKQQCDAIMEEKEKLIGDFQQELRLKDDRYVKDLKKQGDDVDMILERMEQQVHTWTDSYLEELAQIEVAFESERGALVQEQREEWEEALKKRRAMELENLKVQQKRIQDNQQMLHDIRNHDGEEMAQLRNRLENEIQVLQQQMEATKASYQLNTEKLEYNYHVLKKRDEENTAMRNAQKRQLSSLNDQYMNLRKKLEKAKQQSATATQQLSDDYRRITEQFRDLEAKAKHFSEVDKSRYSGIWKMNEEIARGKVERQLAIDRVLQEQQLGATWQAPPEIPTPTLLDDGRIVRAGMRTAHDLVKSIITPTASMVSLAASEQAAGQFGRPAKQSTGAGPQGKPLVKGNSEDVFGSTIDVATTATGVGEEVTTLPSSQAPQQMSQVQQQQHLQQQLQQRSLGQAAFEAASGSEDPRDAQLQRIPEQVIRDVLEMLVEEVDYLMEPKILQMVTTLEADEQLLMKVDSLFKALFIEHEDDVRKLVSYFIEETSPSPDPMLGFPDAETSSATAGIGKQSRTSQESRYAQSDMASDVLMRGTRRLSSRGSGLPSSGDGTTSPSVAESRPASEQSPVSYAVVDIDKVQGRLNRFVKDHNTAMPAERSFWSTSKLASKATVRVDEEFWKKLSMRVPDSSIQTWKGLRDGFQNYLETLKHRKHQQEALAAVTRQNQELEFLLKEYRGSGNTWNLYHPPEI